MTSSPVLVDSSWLIAEARARRDPWEALAEIARSRDLATCGVVRCEVARGIREPKLLHYYQARWDAMLYVPTDNSLWADVEKTIWMLNRSGRNLPLPDVVIACCARRVGAVVLTHDNHFQQIPGIRATDRIV